MAETLGSLVDKLTIKSIREFHIREMLDSQKMSVVRKSGRDKLKILAQQKKALIKEIDEFVAQACRGMKLLRDEKLKLYNKPEVMGRIGKVETLAAAIDGLAAKNLELWHLEDEARREDVALSYIGEIKRKIDKVNQQRNDFIDRIDELLEKKVCTRKKSSA